jgi:hypothetical protein
LKPSDPIEVRADKARVEGRASHETVPCKAETNGNAAISVRMPQG